MECDSLGPGNSGAELPEASLQRLSFLLPAAQNLVTGALNNTGLKWVVSRSSPRILFKKDSYLSARWPEMTSYLSQKVLPVMMAASFLNCISWMDGWVGGELQEFVTSENKLVSPQCFLLRGGFLCSQGTVLRNQMFWNYSIWAPLRFLCVVAVQTFRVRRGLSFVRG